MATFLLGVDYQGEWVEKTNSFSWVAAVKETRPILFSMSSTYDGLVAQIIRVWDIPHERRDICITYMLSVASRQKSAPTRIRGDDDLALYLADVDVSGARPTLRVTLAPEAVCPSYDQDQPVGRLDDISWGAADVEMAENEEVSPPDFKDGSEIYSSATVPSQSSQTKGDGTGFFMDGTGFQCGDVIEKFNRAARHYTVAEFDSEMEEIEAIDHRISKYLEDKVGHEKWSRAHFPGNRHDLMTTNISESVNSTFKEERELPIVALMNAINLNYGKKFYDRRMELLNSTAICTPKIEDKIQKNMTRGNRMTVSETNEFFVTGGTSQDRDAVVDLHSLECSCRRWELKNYPCYHAMAALRDCYGDEFGAKIYEYTSHYYTVDAYVLAYAQTIRPIPPEDFWTDIPDDVLARKIESPDQLKRVGRRKTKRHIGIGERVGRRRNRCGICRRFGHKKTTCPVVTRPSNVTV